MFDKGWNSCFIVQVPRLDLFLFAIQPLFRSQNFILAIALYLSVPLSASGSLFNVVLDGQATAVDSFSSASVESPECGVSFSKTGLDAAIEHILTIEVVGPSTQATGKDLTNGAIFELDGITCV